MDEVIIDIDKELAILRSPKKGQGRLAPVQSFVAIPLAATTSPALIIVDIGHHLCSQGCILLNFVP